jgi:hypothetical protein
MSRIRDHLARRCERPVRVRLFIHGGNRERAHSQNHCILENEGERWGGRLETNGSRENPGCAAVREYGIIAGAVLVMTFTMWCDINRILAKYIYMVIVFYALSDSAIGGIFRSQSGAW